MDVLRPENLDVDIPPDAESISRTQRRASPDAYKSYLPFVRQRRLRDVAGAHVSRISGVAYSGERNCMISAGGLSGILKLLATMEIGDEVIVTDPTYAGLIRQSASGGWRAKYAPFRFGTGVRWLKYAPCRSLGTLSRERLCATNS